MTQAALYLRSSKDRAEMGVPAQRAELKAYAKSKGFSVTAEYSDMEVSGSLDETSRAGLRDMLTALRDPSRGWTHLLAVDTSRIARDSMLAGYVTVQCEKADVSIHYAKTPVDGRTPGGEMTLAVMRAFDRFHARLSGEKGTAGLRANLTAGFRAGGSAPIGYKLKYEETGGTRGGAAVKKSTLVLDPVPAAKVRKFLKARAGGTARHVAAKAAKLSDKAAASLIGIEFNALTYAGYQVWNQRRKLKPTRDEPRRGMVRRPRSEWIISDDPTHEALITRAEAERILALQPEFKVHVPRVVEPDKFILSGLLFTPDGKQYSGDSHDKAYRVRQGKRISAPFIEGQILFHIVATFQDKSFLTRTIAEARKMAEGIEDDPQVIEGAIRKEEKRLAKLASVLAEDGGTAPASVLATMRGIEAKLIKMREQKAAWVESRALKSKLLDINEKDLRGILAATALRMRGQAEAIDMLGYPAGQNIEPDALRRVLTTLVERIELDPDTREFTVRYRLPIEAPKKPTGARLASPRGFEPRLPP